MANPTVVLQKLQHALNMKYGTEGIGSMTASYTTHFPPDDPDETIDVPDVPDTEYITQKSFQLPSGGRKGNKVPKYTEQQLFEQGEDEEEEKGPSPEEMGAAAGAETGEEAGKEAAEPQAPEGDVDTGEMGGDAGGEMGDLGMGGMPGQEEEEPKTAGEIGRIYELKKIYARLTSIESYLAHESDSELLKIRTVISQAIELFEIISANFDSYKEKLDEIIVLYYKFLTEVYNTVRDHYKKHFKK